MRMQSACIAPAVKNMRTAAIGCGKKKGKFYEIEQKQLQIEQECSGSQIDAFSGRRLQNRTICG